MSKIKIADNNNERINNTLDEFEGRRTRNTLSAREIAERAALAEQPDRIILTAEQDNIAVEHFRKRYSVKTV